MGFKLDLSVTKLREGDSIVINTTGTGGGTFTINIVGSQDQPLTLEARDTSDVLPISNEWQEAVTRLQNAIGQIGNVTAIVPADTILSIEFSDGANFGSVVINDGNGSLISAIQVVETTGTVVPLGGSILVPNITVTSVTHTLIEYAAYTSLEFPHGNMGDKLETVINFTSADTFTIADFYYGWLDNDVIVYPGGTGNIFEMDINYFNDITTGALQKFTGDTSSFNAVAPLTGNKVESINLVSAGGNDYTLTLVHYVDILPRPIDRTTDNSLNKPAEIETSLRFVFQIDLKADLITPNPTESTTKQDLTQFVSAGNIGYLGEVYQTGQQFYALNSISFDNVDDEINNGADTIGTIELTKLTGSFDASHDVIVKIVELTDAYEESQTLLQNISFDSAQIKLDTVPVSSTTLQDVSGDFSGNQATITFTVAAASIQTSYALWVSVADGTANKGNQNVLIKVSDVISIADDSTVVFGTFPSAPRAEYNYSMHYLDDVSNSFNQIKSYIDDFVISRFRVTNNDVVNNTLESFTIRIRSGNSVLETFTINADDLATGTFTIPRDFNLPPADVRNNILVVTDGTNYEFVYPFQVLDNWVNASDVVQETLATFTQNTAVGDVEFTNNWISPTFELGNYKITKNTILEPQVTQPPTTIQFFNEAGTIEVGQILKNDITLVVATFEEDNLNDFVADPAAPHTYDTNFVNNYLCAYLGINDNNNVGSKYFRFHNMRDNLTSPWVTVQAGYYALLERLDIDTATLTAKLDPALIKQEYGEDFEELCITARLDKMQDGSLPPIQCILIIQTDVDNVTNVSAQITTGVNSGWKYKGAIIALGDTLNQVIGTGDGTVQDVEYFTDDCDSITTFAATGQEWLGAVDLTQLEFIETIQVNDSRIDDITLKTGNASAITLFDSEDSLIQTLDFTGVNIGGVFMVGKAVESFPLNILDTLTLPVANNELYTEFSVRSSSIVTLDLSQQLNLSNILRIRGNADLTSITLSTSANAFVQISILNSPLLAGTIDISGYTNVNSFQVSNTATNSVPLPISTSVCNDLEITDNPNLTTLDLTPMGNNLATTIELDNNGLTTLTAGAANTQNINLFNVDFNNLAAIDLSNFTGIGVSLRLANNVFPNQAAMNLGTITRNLDLLLIRFNSIAGVWDFTTFIGVNFFGGQFIANNNAITSVVFQSTNRVITLLRCNNNNIVNFTVAPLTGLNNNISVELQFNDMTTVSEDALIVELDNKGWINGNLNVSNQSTGQQPSVGAAAYLSLLGKGWTITI